MILLITSLFLHFDLFDCVDYGKSKFNETVLMKLHHDNYLQVKTFIKEAKKKFHEDTPLIDTTVLETDTTSSWLDNTSSIDLDHNFPFVRSRPSFPVTITPYTTELNDHYLKWNKIFPLQNTKTVPGLRVGARVSSKQTQKLSSTKKQPSFLPTELSLPQPMYQKMFGKIPRFPNPVKSTKKTRSKPSVKIQKSFRPKSTSSHNCSRLVPTKRSFRLKTLSRGHSSKGFAYNLSFLTQYEDYKKQWLREVTPYTPVEKWFQTLASKVGFTPNYSITTKTTLGKDVSKTQILTKKQLKKKSKSQTHLLFLNDLMPKPTTQSYSEQSTPTTKRAQYFIENQGGILHLRTVPEKDQKTTMGRRPGSHREQKTATFKVKVKKKSRRLHLKARQKKYSQLHDKQTTRQSYQRYEYRYPEYSYRDVDASKQYVLDYPVWRSHGKTKEVRRRITIKGSIENDKYGERTHPPNAIIKFSNYAEEEYANLSQIIEKQEISKHKEKAHKNKISFYNQIKNTFKQVESKKKAKRLKLKADLLRKIVEGSSYSDEEESLRKNLVQALHFGNST